MLVYLKANMGLAKASLPGAAHGEVMRALSTRWADAPEASMAQHALYWRSLA